MLYEHYIKNIKKHLLSLCMTHLIAWNNIMIMLKQSVCHNRMTFKGRPWDIHDKKLTERKGQLIPSVLTRVDRLVFYCHVDIKIKCLKRENANLSAPQSVTSIEVPDETYKTRAKDVAIETNIQLSSKSIL